MTTLQKCISILALMALVASFSTATATEVRVGTMGGVGFYTHDNSNIFYFPGAIYSYSGQVYGEFRVKGADNSYTVGVNYPVGDYSVVGLYLNRPLPLTIAANVVDRVTLDQTTDFFYGAQMASYDFGMKLSIGMDNFKTDVPTTPASEVKESARYISLAGGLSNERTDLGAFIELPYAKYDSGAVTAKWSGFGFGVIGRHFSGTGPTKLVPVVAVNYRNTKNKYEPGAAEIKFTDLNAGFGIGLNHQIDENNLLVLALEVLGYQSSKEKTTALTTTNSLMTLPGLFMGVESKIKPWLTGRLGAAEVWQNTKQKSEPTGGTTTETSSRSSQYNVSFGLGFNFGDFTIDAAINEGLFFDGPNFISGTTEPMATRLAAIYKF